MATAAASPTQCYLDYVTLPNDSSTLIDLKQAVAVFLSHLDRIAAPYCNLSMEDDDEVINLNRINVTIMGYIGGGAVMILHMRVK